MKFRKTVIAGCHLLLVKLAQLAVDGVTVMASMAFTGRKKRHRLFGAFRLNAPFFCAGHDHRGVEGLGLWLMDCRRHGGLSNESLAGANFSEVFSGEQIGNRLESSGTRIDQGR